VTLKWSSSRKAQITGASLIASGRVPKITAQWITAPLDKSPQDALSDITLGEDGIGAADGVIAKL
jgi:hypothetical protein